jgi:hypothetical protein
VSLENELVESSVVLANYREKCAVLEQLIRDYDAYLEQVDHLAWSWDEQAQELRKRAREEDIEL